MRQGNGGAANSARSLSPPLGGERGGVRGSCRESIASLQFSCSDRTLGGSWSSSKASSSRCAAARGWWRRSTTASPLSPRCASRASPTMRRASGSRSCGTPRSAPASSQDDAWSHVGRGGTRQPRGLRGLPARDPLALRDCGRPRSAAGAVPGRHPARRLPAPAAAQGARLPRVNLLIADDVGLGKTVEAGPDRSASCCCAAGSTSS